MKTKVFNKEILNKLKKYLDDFNYHLILTIVLGENIYFTNPLPEYKRVKTEIKKLELNIQKIISFFMLGEPIEKKVLENELEQSVINYLYCEQIINQDDTHYWMNNYVLTSYCNCYFVVSNVFYYPTCQGKEQKPYIGCDSYWLSRIIVNKLSGEVLDLCSGSGIQAILAAKTAQHVVAVDIDEESATIAAFNSCLNGVSDKINIRTGNLYDVLNEEEKFDYIISNPPFIPIPDNIDFHKCGDGGADGAEIIRRILNGYTTHLKKNGEAIMIGQCIGDNNKPFIIQNIDECINELETRVVVSGRTLIKEQANGFAELARLYNNKDSNEIKSDAWLEVYNVLNVEYFYNFTLFAYNNAGEHKLIRINDTWDINDIPMINYTSVTEISKTYTVKNYKNQSYVIDDEAATFLKLLDNEKSIEEIVSIMPLKYKLRYGINGEDKQKAKLLSLCSLYERQEIIKKNQL